MVYIGMTADADICSILGALKISTDEDTQEEKRDEKTHVQVTYKRWVTTSHGVHEA